MFTKKYLTKHCVVRLRCFVAIIDVEQSQAPSVLELVTVGWMILVPTVCPLVAGHVRCLRSDSKLGLSYPASTNLLYYTYYV